MKFLLWVAVVFAVLSAVGSDFASAAEERGRYELKDNEWLFVDGKEFRFLEVYHDSKEEALYLNGINIEKKKVKINSQSLKTGLALSDTFYSNVPLMPAKQSEAYSEAVLAYRGKIKELTFWTNEQMKALRADEVSLQTVRSLATKKLETEEYQNCMKVLEIVDRITIKWQPLSARRPLIIMSSSNTPSKNINSFERYINLFGASDHGIPRLIVIGREGQMSIMAANSATLGLKQILSVIDSKRFINGPLGRRELGIFGFPVDSNGDNNE